MLRADKEVTNSQWCHSQKCESACLQLLSTLINSGPGLFDGNRTAKQGRFMKSVSVAPVYFIFKPLCFGGNTSSPRFAHLRDFKGQFFCFFFPYASQGHLSLCALLTCTRQGPANGSQPHICHTSPLSRQPDTRTFPPHRTAGSPNLDATAGKEKEREKKKGDEIPSRGIRIHNRLNSINISLFILQGQQNRGYRVPAQLPDVSTE